MCGIVGFLGTSGAKCNPDKLTSLFLLNEERGRETLGYFTPETGVVKEAGKASEILAKKDYILPSSEVFIGHVRQGTSGGKSASNAHPFHRGDIVLVMNGTICNHWELGRKYGMSTQDYFVDSDVICGLLNLTKSKQVLTEIDGGCAILYSDLSNNKQYVYRNADRPLYRGMNDGGMYISSTQESLNIIKCNDVKEFKQDYLYEIVEGKIVNTIPVKRYEKPTTVLIRTKRLTSPIGLFNLKAHMLVGKFVEATKTVVLKGKDDDTFLVSQGYKYEIGMPDKNMGANQINIRNPRTGLYYLASKSMFSNTYEIPGIGDYLLALDDIVYNDEMLGKFAIKGDLIRITAFGKAEREIAATNEITGKKTSSLVWSSSILRAASDREVKDKKESFYKNLFEAEGYNADDYDDLEYYKQWANVQAPESPKLLEEKKVEIEEIHNISEEDSFKADLDEMRTSITNYEDLGVMVIELLKENIEFLDDISTFENSQLNVMNRIKMILDVYDDVEPYVRKEVKNVT